MAGAGLIAIKRRIKSVTNTQKITKAMGLVATAKLRKSRERLSLNERYYMDFNAVMKEILDNHEGFNIYTHGNKSKKKLYIVLTSDSGLCGGYNITAINMSLELMGEDRENSLIMVVGQKGKVSFNKLKRDTIAEYVDMGDLPTLKEAEIIMNHALDLYNNGKIGEINVVYTKFISMVRQTVEVDKILPLDFKEENFDKGMIEFEPTVRTILNASINSYTKQKLFHYLCNAKASEQGARMTAMDNATKNADEMLEDMKLKYNRIRQSAITQEISEIVGGAEAQK